MILLRLVIPISDTENLLMISMTDTHLSACGISQVDLQ